MITSTFTLGSKRYHYTLGDPVTDNGEQVMPFTCPELGIDQEFLVEDVPGLILDLPNIAHNLHQQGKTDTVLRIRIKTEDKKKIEQKAMQAGKSTSAYIREKALQ